MQHTNKLQDHSSSPDTEEPDVGSLQTLKYPCLSIDGALDFDVTTPSTMTTDSNLEHSTVSLLDNSYEVVDRTSIPSDSEPHDDAADSLASFSESALSEVSFEDTETSSQDGISLEASAVHVEQPQPEHIEEEATPSLAFSRADSASTSQTITQSLSNGFQIRFSGKSARGDMVDLMNRLAGRPDARSFNYNVEIAKGDEFVQIHRPLRIVYHGDATKLPGIVNKIAQALVVSEVETPVTVEDATPTVPKNERQQLRTQKSSPDIQQRIVVEQCRGACCIDRLTNQLQREARRTSLGMSRNQLQVGKDAIKNFVDCPCYEAEQEEAQDTNFRPDLAVFLHATQDDQSAWNEASLACSAHIAGQGIPTLDLSEVRLRYPPSLFQAFGGEAPHISVEDTTTNLVVAKMPLDLETFLALNTGDLSRNLTLIMDMRGSSIEDSKALWLDVLKGVRDGFFELMSSYSRQKTASSKTLGYKFGLAIFYVLTSSLVLIAWVFIAKGISTLMAGSSQETSPSRIITNVTYVSALTTVWASSTPGAIVDPLTSFSPVMPPKLAIPTPKPDSDTVMAPFVPREDFPWPGGIEVNVYQDDNGQPFLDMTRRFISLKTPEVWFKVSTEGQEVNGSLIKVNHTFYKIDFGYPDRTYGLVDLSLWIKGIPRIAWKLDRHHKSPPELAPEMSLWDIRKAFRDATFPESLVLGQTLGYNMLTRAVQEVNSFARETSVQLFALTVNLKGEVKETTKALSKLYDTVGTRVVRLARYPNPITQTARKELIRVTRELTPYVDAIKVTLARNAASLRQQSKSLQLRERFVFPLKKARARATSILGVKKKKTVVDTTYRFVPFRDRRIERVDEL